MLQNWAFMSTELSIQFHDKGTPQAQVHDNHKKTPPNHFNKFAVLT